MNHLNEQDEIPIQAGIISMDKDNDESDFYMQRGRFCKYSCRHCGKKNMTKWENDNHERTHTKERPFSCHFCGKLYTAPSALYKHLRQKHRTTRSEIQASHEAQESIFVDGKICSFCGKKLCSNSSLKLHERIHTGERPYHCSYCKKTFRTRGAGLMHMRRVHKKEPLLWTFKLLRVGMVAENDIKTEADGVDTIAATDEVTVKPGETTAVQEKTGDSAAVEGNGSKQFEVSEGGLPYSRKSEVVLQVGYHPEGTVFKCPECLRDFCNGHELCNHIQQEHDWESWKDKFLSRTEKTFKCPYCPKVWKKKSELATHVRYHTGERPFKCPECEKSYTSPQNFTRHMQYVHELEFNDVKVQQVLKQARAAMAENDKKIISHSLEKEEQDSVSTNATTMIARTINGKRKLVICKYKCSVCGKGWYYKNELTRHERSHTGEKPYKCPECGYAFSRVFGLKNHMKTVHKIDRSTGDRILENFGYATNAKIEGIDNDDVVESNENNVDSQGNTVHQYKCSFCSKGPFAKYQDRDEHERTHDIYNRTQPKMIFKFKCSFCQKKFQKRCDRREHERLHTGEKPISCLQCDMMFRTRDALSRHTRKDHGKESVGEVEIAETVDRQPNSSSDTAELDISTPSNALQNVLGVNIIEVDSHSEVLSSNNAPRHQTPHTRKVLYSLLTPQNVICVTNKDVESSTTPQNVICVTKEEVETSTTPQNVICVSKEEVETSTTPQNVICVTKEEVETSTTLQDVICVTNEDITSTTSQNIICVPKEEVETNTISDIVGGEGGEIYLELQDLSEIEQAQNIILNSSYEGTLQNAVENMELCHMPNQPNAKDSEEPIVSVIDCEHGRVGNGTTHLTGPQRVIKLNYNGQVRLFTLQPFDCSDCIKNCSEGQNTSNNSLFDRHPHVSKTVESDVTNSLNISSKSSKDQSNTSVQDHLNGGIRSSKSKLSPKRGDKHCRLSNKVSGGIEDANNATDVIAHSRELKKQIPSMMSTRKSLRQAMKERKRYSHY